jgi:hypothetical protein
MLASLFAFETGRFDVEQSSGGNPSWNVGVDYRRLLAQLDNADQVRSLYQAAGLDLRTDLRVLTRTADEAPDLDAVARLRRTSTLSGRLEMPVLTIHTTDDELVPVQHEEEYAEDVRQAGDRRLLRQTYVDRPGHCTFTPAELVAGVETIAARVETGRCGSSTRPQRLQASPSPLISRRRRLHPLPAGRVPGRPATSPADPPRLLPPLPGSEERSDLSLLRASALVEARR